LLQSVKTIMQNHNEMENHMFTHALEKWKEKAKSTKAV